MPTLTWLDSFEHQNAASTYYGTNAGLFDVAPSTQFALWSYVTGRRTGSHALRIAQNGTNAARAGKVVAAGNRVLVESFYFKCSAKPSVDSSLWASTGAVSNSNIQIASATGFLAIHAVAAGSVTNGNVDVTDGQWHRLDLKLDTSANPYKLDVSLDGVAQTQNTSGAAAGDINSAGLGTISAAHTLTADYADWVRSVTGADHPIGDHICVPLIPNADGTHNWASTNMGDSTGGRASSVTDLNTMVDEFPANTTDYIAYTNTTATGTEYAEILLPDVGSGATIWAARAIAAIFSATTTANSATTRVVDGSGTTVLDLYVGDQSDTSLRHQASLLPGVDTPSEVNALKWRVGFPTDSNPAPRWSALMVDIALSGATGDGTASPSAVAGVGAVPAPTADGGAGAATATPSTVAGIGAVPAPTASGTATAAPAATAGTGSVPAPTTSGAATAAPAATAGVGAVPAPTTTGAATASPTATAGNGLAGLSNSGSGVQGATVSTSDKAQGTPWDLVNIGAGSTVTYDTKAGGMGPSVKVAKTSTDNNPLEWNAALADSDTQYGQIVLWFDTAPTTSSQVIVLYRDGTTNEGRIRIKTDGTLEVTDAAGTAQATSSTVLTGALWRIEWRHVRNASTGSWLVNLYAGTSLIETLNPTNINTGAATTTNVRFGTTGGISGTFTFWLRDFNANQTELPSTTLARIVPAPTASGNATAAPTAVAGTGSVPAPSVFVSVTALPAVTAGTGSVPAPTATGTANTSPATVAGIGSVPAPTATGVGNGTATPPATAGIGAVPAPSASGQAKTTPAQVDGTGTVPAPTATGPAVAAPTVTAGIGAVPAPSAHGNATAKPGATAGIGAVPDPTVTAVVPGTAHPDEVAGIGLVPAPTVFVSARARPQVCAGIGSVPAPTGHGNATAFPLGGSCTDDEFTSDFTDDFGGFGPFSDEFSIEFDEVTSCFGPVAGVGAVPAPHVTGQSPAQTQHDFDPSREGPRFTAAAHASWRGSHKEPALTGRANPEGGG